MKLLWIDIETTSLHPDAGTILELAYAVADLADPFNPEPGLDVVLRFTDDQAEMLSPAVRRMHTENGLLAECRRSLLGVADLEEHLLSVLPEVDAAAEVADWTTLAGSSVHFDHAFIRAKLPLVAARLSYRHYDVSAVKLFCQSLGMPAIPKAMAHRARADLLESIAHAKQCAEWLMLEGLKRGGV